MGSSNGQRDRDRWARLRFAVVGPLLASPPPAGKLRAELERLSRRDWDHPSGKGPVRFSVSTIERWYYQARAEDRDPVKALRRRARADAGRERAMSPALIEALREQYRAHPSWSAQLHYDNLRARAEADPALGPMPSYATLTRAMRNRGLVRQRRRRRFEKEPVRPAVETREVLSYEVSRSHALWHCDFHHGKRRVLTESGEWKTPILLGFLDDHSRLGCHLQWYLSETAEVFVHGLCQGFMKRGLPRALMSDNGSAMTAGEVEEGLHHLGIVPARTLAGAPYQNGKMEVLWASVEGRLMAMLEGVVPLTLKMLNDATVAWVEHEYWHALHRGYRALAARAKQDARAAKQFDESNLWLDSDPVEAMAILRQHPLIKPGLVGTGVNEGVEFGVLNRVFRSDLSYVVSCLAKLSVIEGGGEAAGRLHRYLVAATNMCVPAQEITVFHGLIVGRRVDLDRGAYLAPYELARREFNLPDGPEPFPKKSYPNAAALVRGLEYGPGIGTFEDNPGLPDVQIHYRFPTDYRIELEAWFQDSKLLVDLLSMAAGVPLLSRTRYVRLDRWIEEIDPNFAFGSEDSGGFTSDVWPKGRELSDAGADAFLRLSRGWHAYPGRSDAMALAVRRLAASLSRPGGRFGEEDRILDTAIALEVFYGGTTGRKLSRRAAALLGADAEEQIGIFEQARRFYRTRSNIVHPELTLAPEALHAALEAGRDLARRTLAALLKRNAAVRWADVLMNLTPEAQAHIDATNQ